jgi:TIR domain
MTFTEVFLSHSSADRTVASRIAKRLREHGIPTFYTATDLVGAQQ